MTKESRKEIEVKLHNASGDEVGTAKVVQQTSGVKITIKGKVSRQESHGLHVHEIGECKAPRFESSGNHFNPDDKNMVFLIRRVQKTVIYRT